MDDAAEDLSGRLLTESGPDSRQSADLRQGAASTHPFSNAHPVAGGGGWRQSHVQRKTTIQINYGQFPVI